VIKRLTALAALLFATQASAEGFLVKCVSGCPEQAVQAPKLKADGEVQVKDTLWFGLSLGLQLAARDNATKEWEAGISLAFQYGFFWRPAWWGVTKSFASINLGVAAGTTINTGSPFVITVPVTVTLLDILAVGYGPRFKLATNSGMTDTVSGVLFFGLATSFGGP